MTESSAPAPFTEAQQRALARALDEIIPPSDDGRLPGAGDAGVARYVEAALGETPMLIGMVVESLDALEKLANERHARSFLALPSTEQSALLQTLSMSEHALPPVIMIHTFAGYYQNDRVQTALGLEPRPPHPKGYAMHRNDMTLLDPVRARARHYRDV
jgi:hypothetical protein